MSDAFVLASWGYSHETEPARKGAPLRSWRWCLEIGRFGIYVAKQVKYPPHDWESFRPYGLGIWGAWLWGIRHDYYDGPHCSAHLGFLHITWTPDWCCKCMPDCHGGACGLPTRKADSP